MIISKLSLFFLCIVIFIAIYLANLLALISENHGVKADNESRGRNYTKRMKEKYKNITDSDENIVWFIQISDIHISIFRDPTRITEFRHFCENTIRIVRPSVTLASGDLTDAKTQDNIGSTQFQGEWEHYYNTIKSSSVDNYTVWLDIRGNHDNFDVIHGNANNNYFKSYSVQGPQNPRSYAHVLKNNGVKVGFMGVDACSDPGLKRPFNFIGLIVESEFQNLKKLQYNISKEVDHVVWFGHYPSSCILWLNEGDENTQSLRDLIGNMQPSMVYVCGHLHSMAGLVPKMYTMQQNGYLELELSDWKDGRVFRLAAIDHGLFSFIDQRHSEWPLSLVTNPKHSQYIMTGREPLELMQTSTHVRILVFSDVPIIEVKISIDKDSWIVCKAKKEPLYTCPWNSGNYMTGYHEMKVYIKDQLAREQSYFHPFSLDGTKIKNFDISSRLLLMTDAEMMFQSLFGTMLLICILPLSILRFNATPPKIGQKKGMRFVKNIWLLSQVKEITYPLILYALYVSCGPWMIGELIEGYIGAVFVWGIFINRTFVPGSFTYAFAFLHFCTVQCPLTFILASAVERRVRGVRTGRIKHILHQLPFVLLLTMQMVMAYFFWLAYGTMAFVIGPLRTWSILLNILLWYRANTIPTEICGKLAQQYFGYQ